MDFINYRVKVVNNDLKNALNNFYNSFTLKIKFFYFDKTADVILRSEYKLFYLRLYLEWLFFVKYETFPFNYQGICFIEIT